ncbi:MULTISPECIES: ATP-binding protein [Methylobacterium]|uniref:ATP-binding protein n=1 Tax=Methylobacterium TaxID=407 RepID=UPI0009E893CC|nr:MULTISPECIES: ATP-binding protein [Methylobacterium]MCI9882022.1 response regulator [Methylobacterium goesingense]
MTDPRPAPDRSGDPRPSARQSRRQRTLAGRLALAVFASVALAFLAGTLLSLWQEVNRYADDKRDSLVAIANVLAASGAQATAAGDPAGAGRVLNAIGKFDGAGTETDGADAREGMASELVYAAIERPDGSILADRGLTARLANDFDLRKGQSPLALLTSRTALVSVPVAEAGRIVGSLILVSDLADLNGRLLALLRTSALISSLVMVLGFAISYAIQRAITQPIAALAGTMDRVRVEQDYDQAAAIVRDDEVGVLARSFNALLETVRERDARLARHMQRLEADVAERTADLHEAKQAAEAANAAKSSFLATMSHEIRTPLNGMLVMAELLAASELPQRQQRYAEVVARSGQSLLAIINDILDFAKVEAGKLDLERIPVDPAEIVDTVVSLFAEKAVESGLDLAASVAPDVPRRVTGDPVRLGQILSNFVNNALKFTPSGSVLVRLERGAGGMLRLSVRDTGVGIPADKVGTLFSAFSQVDQSTTRRFGGTGLGLSIAHRLALAMGGRMGVDSVLGEGSTFWAELPLEAIDTDASAPIRRADAVVAGIVVAVPGQATRDSLSRRLAEAGFAPRAAASAEAGTAHWIADAATILALGHRPTGAGRVLALARLGDPAAAPILEAGWADHVLAWPVVQEEWRVALAALAGGTPFAARAAGPAARARLPQFPAARILVADDSPVNREVAREALARCGVTAVTLVEDGRLALEACRDRTFDLVLMDGSMPVLDGYAAAEAIRAEARAEGRARTPIVALTAHVVGAGADAWRDAGMDAKLAKPFTLSALADTLAGFLVPDTQSALPPVAGTTAEPASPPVAAPESESDGLLDADVVAGLVDMAARAGGDFAARILGLYREHAPRALADLQAAWDSADAEAVARTAHSLKSMSLNIGGRALAETLGAIEAQARSGSVPTTEAEIAALSPLLARTMAAVDARFGPPSASEETGAARRPA